MSFLYDVLALSIGITPLILILLLLSRVLQKYYSARWRYAMWTAIAIRLLLPVSWISLAPVAIEIPAAFTPGPPAAGSPVPLIHTALPPAAAISPGQILGILYLAGILSYLAYKISGYMIFRRDVLRWSRKPARSEIDRLLLQLRSELGIRREIPVRISKKAPGPMIVGLLRPVLLLPSEEYADRELHLILTHELVHFKRHDIWYKLGFMLAAAVHWFNPAVHLLVREANRDLELSCDNQVLRGADLAARKYYGNIILNLAIRNNDHQGPVFSTCIKSSKEALESRLKGIFDARPKRRGIAALALIVALVMMAGLGVAIGNTESLLPGSPAGSRLSAASEVNSGIQDADATGPDSAEASAAPGRGNSGQPEGVPAPSNPSNGETPDETRGADGMNEKVESPAHQGSAAQVVLVDLTQLEKQAETDTTSNVKER